MRKLVFLAATVCVLGLVPLAGDVECQGCTAVQSGELFNSLGEPINPGFNHWGYNYQARLFSGGYCDAYYNAAWCQPYADAQLSMKWNDAWLSNADCDGDGLLDRHAGFASYRGSGAWITNHMRGSYVDGGKKYNWEVFTKIVAAPLDAVKMAGVWYTAGGVEIGPDIWDEFVIIQDVYNDPGGGFHGISYLSPYSAGFGRF